MSGISVHPLPDMPSHQPFQDLFNHSMGVLFYWVSITSSFPLPILFHFTPPPCNQQKHFSFWISLSKERWFKLDFVLVRKICFLLVQETCKTMAWSGGREKYQPRNHQTIQNNSESNRGRGGAGAHLAPKAPCELKKKSLFLFVCCFCLQYFRSFEMVSKRGSVKGAGNVVWEGESGQIFFFFLWTKSCSSRKWS